ncbi:uracil-5--methyltransferase TRM9 [Plectosphaerella plurivora]|uniref:Uracil-5--methyltransferase TRM9 n=1 Tax=Plectosphaerella plurivora TaxID=936078 RepID=A0A9P8VCS0_9PEZI|nr:uracil-5--methyltransferase TRM9 [Plectosphaerella plurivora]
MTDDQPSRAAEAPTAPIQSSSAAKPARDIPAPPSVEDSAESYESTHVHAVYEAIAPHFSSTRHKPWPRVAAFLASLPAGAVGIDVGCGNGKYLAVNRDLVILGSDRSANLIALARDNDGSMLAATAGSRSKTEAQSQTKGKKKKQQQQQPEVTPPVEPFPTPRIQNEVIVADSLSLPYRPSSADFAISIAVLHHLSTPHRRRLAVRAILDCLRPGGQALLYVWALEQGSSRRGWDQASTQDQLVPWVTKGGSKLLPKAASEAPEAQPQQGGDDATWHRYYHLYKQGELEDDIRDVGGEIVESGYERDNWWAICARAADDKDTS